MIDRNQANLVATDRPIGIDLLDAMPWGSESQRDNGEV
ncbi:hypothetical protein V7x_32880 [Crateriforma conspicua]|uniref:Uncharacterized protein n=1 Tax=Crateriforma conspicua TaxID=2527996 RepID=A0A5C6FYT7_9PLAN|nr:hypothetical protein V7x_32880 [Crateriforma conspicua]